MRITIMVMVGICWALAWKLWHGGPGYAVVLNIAEHTTFIASPDDTADTADPANTAGSVGREGSVRSSQHKKISEAVALELVAAILASGASIARSLEVLAQVCSHNDTQALLKVVHAMKLGVAFERAWPETGLSSLVQSLADTLIFAAYTGALTANSLRSAAVQLRHARNRQAQLRAGKLAVRLTLPLGLCLLPAFICWGVIPVILSVIPAL